MTLGPWLAQVHTYPVGGYMEQLVRLCSCGHTPSWSSVQDPRVALSLWLAQVVHIYPVARRDYSTRAYDARRVRNAKFIHF